MRAVASSPADPPNAYCAGVRRSSLIANSLRMSLKVSARVEKSIVQQPATGPKRADASADDVAIVTYSR